MEQNPCIHSSGCHFKVVLGGSPRCPDNHDLSKCHRLYDLGRHHLPPISLTLSNLTPKNYRWQPPGTTLTTQVIDYIFRIPFTVKKDMVKICCFFLKNWPKTYPHFYEKQRNNLVWPKHSKHENEFLWPPLVCMAFQPHIKLVKRPSCTWQNLLSLRYLNGDMESCWGTLPVGRHPIGQQTS